MAAEKRTFVCSCFFVDNVYLKKYRLHVSYRNRKDFIENYAKELRNRGCVTEEQFADVISEAETEIARRQSLGEASLYRREEIQKTYVPLHREVFFLQESFLDPRFLDLVSSAKSPDNNIGRLPEHLQALGDRVYTFPIFTNEFSSQLVEELEHIEHSSCPKGRPNSMNSYGVLLDEFGFNSGLLDPLRKKYLKPLTSLLFPDCGGNSLDSHKAFTVTYESGFDIELGCHYDNAEVTLNVCLCHNGYSGGDLFFLGIRGERSAEDSGRLTYQHRPGWGILHRGLHLHGAEAVTNGKRSNLVMWMRSSLVRNKYCPMCGSMPTLVESWGADDGFRVNQGQQIGASAGLEETGFGSDVDRALDPQVVDVCQAL